jgi:uncharacterized protein (DUF169 family)
MAAAMAEKEDISADAARGLLFDTPRMETGITAVTVGDCEAPDVVLSCVQPAAAMRLLRRRQRREGNVLIAGVSCVMAVCGSVAVRAYLNNRISMSFGCPDSREHGSIGRDRLIMGLPTELVRTLV